MSRRPRRPDELLLGEWACLGILAEGTSHGFEIARRLSPDGDIGRVWSLSRALTYRALTQLEERGLVDPAGHEPGVAGGDRTMLSITTNGRRLLDDWLSAPVVHLRDLRSELLLKLVVCGNLGVDTRPLVAAQREIVVAILDRADVEPGDAVSAWRHEIALAAARFLERFD